jgi:hypothetical protein
MLAIEREFCFAVIKASIVPVTCFMTTGTIRLTIYRKLTNMGIFMAGGTVLCDSGKFRPGNPC